jgi:hemolysin D
MSSTQLAIVSPKVKNSVLEREAAHALLEYQPATAALINTPVSPLSARIGVVVSLLVVSCMGVIALFPLDRVVTASGRTVAGSPTAVLQPLETSIVRSVNVQAGETVKKGQLLATLDPTFAGSDAAQYEAQVQSYGAEVDRESAELANRIYVPTEVNHDTTQQKAMFDQRKAALDAQLDEYRQKIASLQQAATRSDSDVVGYRSRLAIAASVETMRKQLESLQVGSKLNTLSAEDTRTELERQLAYAVAASQGARSDLASEIQERDYTLQNWRATTSQALTEAERNLSDARQYLAKAARRKDLVRMRADADSTVQWVAKVSTGSVMQPGDQLMSLVPNDATLSVEAKIPGDQIGFVAPGQKVSLKFDTLYTQIYGFATGTVLSVSPDSFLANDTGTTTSAQRATAGLPSSLAGNSPNENPDLVTPGYYRATISIDSTKFRNLPPNFHMMPGMSLAADVEVGKRTLLAYLLGRVAPQMTEAFREP